MRDLNKVMLIGRLARDPELRYLPDGTPVPTMTVATGRRWKGAEGQYQEETEWTPVVAWRKLAELAHQYLATGRPVYVEGRLQTRTWDDEAGQKHAKTEVVASELILLDSRRGEEAGLLDAAEELDGERSLAPQEAPRPSVPAGLAPRRKLSTPRQQGATGEAGV